MCFSIIILICKMNINGTEWYQTEKLIDIRGLISKIKCVSLSSSWSKNESQQNRTEQNGKTDKHRGNKFNVQVCFSIIILISKMNLNRTEWNGTEKLIDIRGINLMFNCVSLSSSWSPKWISTERNGMKKLIDVYVRISRIFCVSVSELLNPLQYPSIKFGSGTV